MIGNEKEKRAMRGFRRQRSKGVIVALVFSILLFPVVVFAGNLDSSDAPVLRMSFEIEGIGKKGE